MAPPAIIKARFFQRISDSAWTARVDTSGPNPSMTIAEAEAHAATEYGFPVRCVEADYPDLVQFDMVRAQRMLNAVKPPAQPPPPLTPEQVAWASATTIAQIKAIIGKRLGLEP